VRALDPEERLHLESTRIIRIASHEMARLPEALSEVNRRTRRVYVRVDADVLDISEGSGEFLRLRWRPHARNSLPGVRSYLQQR